MVRDYNNDSNRLSMTAGSYVPGNSATTKNPKRGPAAMTKSLCPNVSKALLGDKSYTNTLPLQNKSAGQSPGARVRLLFPLQEGIGGGLDSIIGMPQVCLLIPPRLSRTRKSIKLIPSLAQGLSAGMSDF